MSKPTPKRTPTDVPWVKLMTRIKFRSDGCWLWNGYIGTGGYGRVCVRGRQYAAHRVVYANYHGALDDRMVLDHTCRNERCVSPFHCEPVPARENSRRRRHSHLRSSGWQCDMHNRWSKHS